MSFRAIALALIAGCFVAGCVTEDPATESTGTVTGYSSSSSPSCHSDGDGVSCAGLFGLIPIIINTGDIDVSDNQVNILSVVLNGVLNGNDVTLDNVLTHIKTEFLTALNDFDVPVQSNDVEVCALLAVTPLCK